MWVVRVGTRVTFVLLLALTPAVATYTYWSVQRSTRTYITDLKRETHATTRGLAPSLENEIKEGRWDQIRSVLERISTEGTQSLLFGVDGKPFYAPHDFPSDRSLPLRNSDAQARKVLSSLSERRLNDNGFAG